MYITPRGRKYSTSDLRLVIDYLRAIRNEVALDEKIFKLAGLDPAAYGKFPRPSRWCVKAQGFSFISLLLYRLSMLAWGLVGPLFFVKQSHILKQHRERRPVIFHPAGQILGFSQRAIDIVDPNYINPFPKQWLELPWLPIKDLPDNSEVLSAVDLLDSFDTARALRLAIFAHHALERRKDIPGWGLQTYTAWRWFLARLTIDKLPGPLLTVQHFDRWAILVDGSVRKTLRQNPSRSLTVMQHGALNASATPPRLGIKLPTRLHSVSHLIAYSEADVNVFKEEILSARCCERGINVTFFRPKITLTEKTGEGKPSILFVGHPLCEATHCALLVALQRHQDWHIFYKPHPTSPASNHISKLTWTVIAERMVFPRVDVIVSYPSTLVTEYASHGIPAVLHPLELPSDQAESLLPEILELMSSKI